MAEELFAALDELAQNDGPQRAIHLFDYPRDRLKRISWISPELS